MSIGRGRTDRMEIFRGSGLAENRTTLRNDGGASRVSKSEEETASMMYYKVRKREKATLAARSGNSEARDERETGTRWVPSCQWIPPSGGLIRGLTAEKCEKFPLKNSDRAGEGRGAGGRGLYGSRPPQVSRV